MSDALRPDGVDFGGDEFVLTRSGSGIVSFDPAYEIRNDRDELLLRAKQELLDLDDAFVLFGPDETPLFRWKNRNWRSPTDARHRYLLYEADGDDPVALFERPSRWKPLTWYLSVGDDTVTLDRGLLPVTELTVHDSDDRALCHVKQALIRHRFRVRNDGLPTRLKAALLMALPLLRYSNRNRGGT